MQILNTSALLHTIMVDGQDLSPWFIQGSLRNDLISAGGNTLILTCSGSMEFQADGSVDLDDYTNPALRRGAPVSLLIRGQRHPRGTLFVLDARYDATSRSLQLSVGCPLAYRSSETFPDEEEDSETNCSIVQDEPPEYDLAYFLEQAKLQYNIEAELKTIKVEAAPGSRIFEAINRILQASNAYCWADKNGVVQVENYNLGEPEIGGIQYDLRSDLVSFNRVAGGAPPAPKYRAKGKLSVLSTPEEIVEELEEEDTYLASRITDRNGNVSQSQAGPRETVTYEYEGPNGQPVRGSYTYNKIRRYNKTLGCKVASEQELIRESRGKVADGLFNALGAQGQPQDSSRNDLCTTSNTITTYSYYDDGTLQGKSTTTIACVATLIGSIPWESRELEPIEITNALASFTNQAVVAKTVERYKKLVPGLTLRENFEYAVRGLSQSDTEAFQKGNATVSDISNRAAGLLRLVNYSSEVIEGSGPAPEQPPPFFFRRSIDYDVTVEIPPRGTPIAGLEDLPVRKLSAPDLLESVEEVETWLRRYAELDVCEYKSAAIATGWRDEFYDWRPLEPFSVVNLDGVIYQFQASGSVWAFSPTEALCSFDGLYVGQLAGSAPQPFQPDFLQLIPETESDQVFIPDTGSGGSGGDSGSILFPSAPPPIGTPIVISSTGSLPAGLSNGQTVFVQSVNGNQVTVSSDPAGSNPIVISGTGSGRVTIVQSPFNPTADTIAVTGAIPPLGAAVQVTTTGTLPQGLQSNTTYFVVPAGAGQIRLSSDPQGQSIIDIQGFGSGIVQLVTPPAVIPPFELINRRSLKTGSRISSTWINAIPAALKTGSRMQSQITSSGSGAAESEDLLPIFLALGFDLATAITLGSSAAIAVDDWVALSLIGLPIPPND